jgi:hypothetical protein
MHDQEPTVPDTIAEHAPEPAAPTLAHEPVEEEQDWFDEPEEMPRRPRRRLLTPVPIALAGVLLLACGFIGGVLVEKGQSSTGSSASAGAASGFAARLAGLRGTRTGGEGSAGGAAAGGGGGGAAGGATTGQVAFIQGSTLYVTNTQGNTVKVNTSSGATVTKTVSSNVKSIHPGETVVIVGATGADGSVSAESIRVGASGGGGLGSLFGGSGSTGTSSSGTGASSGGTGASSGGTGASGGGAGSGPSLFGGG